MPLYDAKVVFRFSKLDLNAYPLTSYFIYISATPERSRPHKLYFPRYHYLSSYISFPTILCRLCCVR